MSKSGIDTLSEQIVMLSASIYPLFREIFKDYHPDEIAVLHILRINNGEISRRELIKELGIEEKVVSRRIRNLVSHGLVQSNRRETSAREVVDKITDKGNYEFENIRNKMKLLIKGAFRFVSDEEQRILRKIIEQTQDKIDRITEIVKRIV